MSVVVILFGVENGKGHFRAETAHVCIVVLQVLDVTIHKY